MGKSKKVSDDKEPPASKKQRTQKGVPAEETQTEAVPAAQPQTQAVPAAAAETQTKAVPAAEPRPSRSRSRSRNRQALSDAIAAIPERDVERLVQETGSHSAKEALDKLKNIMDPKFTGETITLVPAELLPDSPSTESDMAGGSRLAPGAAAAHTAATGAGEGQGNVLAAAASGAGGESNAAASGAGGESESAASGARGESAETKDMDDDSDSSEVLQNAAPGAGASAEAPAARARHAPAPTPARRDPTNDLSQATMLEVPTSDNHASLVKDWIKHTKEFVDGAIIPWMKKHKGGLNIDVPQDVLMIPARKIMDAHIGAQLTSYRETMNYSNLQFSLKSTNMYEAAGTVFMLDPCKFAEDEAITLSQLEAAKYWWSEEAFVKSSPTDATMRRFTFQVPFPVRVETPNVAQRKEPKSEDVLMAQALPMIAGKPIVVTWYLAIAKALRSHDDKKVERLLEAGLSVPIILKKCKNDDECHIAALAFAEQTFSTAAASGADNFWVFAQQIGRISQFANGRVESLSQPKFLQQLKTLAITFKNKPMTDANAKALKSLLPFVTDKQCNLAFSRLDAVCSEFREPTILMRLAQLCSKRAAPASGGEMRARDLLVHLFDCLYVARLTGDQKKTTSGQSTP